MKIGSVHLNTRVNREGFLELLGNLDLKPPVIVKPNWGTSSCFVEAEILVWVLTAVDGDAARAQEMYGFVPERLLEIRGSDLLSLAKVKMWLPPFRASLAVKNLFGMIPGPGRLRYHGKKNSRVNQSIADIYKIYESLFDVKGVVEAVFTASVAARAPVRCVGPGLKPETWQITWLGCIRGPSFECTRLDRSMAVANYEKMLILAI